MDLKNAAGVVLLSITVVACGGGGGSAPPPTGGGTPPPAPVTPPPPPPPPPPTYELATDFSADRQYPGWGVEVVSEYKAPPPGSAAGTAGTRTYQVTFRPETLGAGFTYTAATKTYVVRWIDFSKSYGPTVDGLNVGRQPFSALDDFVRTHPWTDNASQDYARYFGTITWGRFEGSNNAAQDSVVRSYYSVFGTKTLASDVPRTGVYNYTFFPVLTQFAPPKMVDGSDLYRVVQDSWSAKIDWPTRTLTGTLRLDPVPSAPAGTQPLAIAMTGTVEADRTSVVGKFAATGVTGEFTGNLFGPQGRELGFVYRITINGSEAFVGATGSKGS